MVLNRCDEMSPLCLDSVVTYGHGSDPVCFSQSDAEQMLDQLVRWVRVDPSGLGRPQMPGDSPVNSMAVPMMLLCLVNQLSEGRPATAQKYSEVGDWSVKQILQHAQVNQRRKGK